jgi:hypothetical protein
MEKNFPVPSQYDGTQFIISVILPSKHLTTTDVYDYVYGVCLNDGAKPWPYYQDSNTKQWWSLSSKSDVPIQSLVWMISLKQLQYRPKILAQKFLEEVLPVLSESAQKFEGITVPECDIIGALAKMDSVVRMLEIHDKNMTILVCAPEGKTYTVWEWWDACTTIGLQHGDGDLFWLMNDEEQDIDQETQDSIEPYEYFSVEPYSQEGYFHIGDLKSSISFPDVALSFRIRDFRHPDLVLQKMADVAIALANYLHAQVLTTEGTSFEIEKAQIDLQNTRERQSKSLLLS